LKYAAIIFERKAMEKMRN